MSDKNVKHMQMLLRELSFSRPGIRRIIPTGEFTHETALAVRDFQRSANLPATGDIDEATWNAITDAAREDLPSVEPEALDISALQKMLSEISDSYANILRAEITGELDDNTRGALRQIRVLSLIEEGDEPDAQTLRAVMGIHRCAAVVDRVSKNG